MRASDLAPLLTPAPSTGPTMRQGTILTFDPATGQNTVQSMGATLSNLSRLGTATYAPGDVVALASFGTSLLILGPITTPS